MTKVAYHQQVAEKIIEQLKQGQAPWTKPWEPGNANGQVPFNPVTGKRYRGINALYLMMTQGHDNRWVTYKQAQSIGAQVRKGEKGTTVQYWKFTEEKNKTDEQGKPLVNEQGESIKVQVNLERPKVFYATVFHASQIEGMPEFVIKKPDWDCLERAEFILKHSGASINHSETDRAFYRSSTDSIHLPPKNQFKSAALYYATALHELGHWTGHESRLNRDLGNPFGSEAYAREELRAEIASMLLGDDLGIGHDPSQHTSYIKSWIKVLEDDPLEIFRAASDAEKIMTHIKSLELQHEQELQIETKEERQESALMQSTPNVEKIYLKVPFHQKETVKSLAGKLENGENAIAWDKDAKLWFAKPGANFEPLKPWLEPSSNEKKIASNRLEEKTYLAIPFKHKDTVKSLVGKLDDGSPGLAWDKTQKCWYARPGVDREIIAPWLPGNAPQQEAPQNPVDEFKMALISAGAIVSDEHPIMDGKTHRIKAEGDKSGERAIFYVGHLDGVPAGFIKNNRTGVEFKWKSKGYTLSDEEKANLQAVALEKKKAREHEVAERQQSTALKLQTKLSHMHEISEPTPYIASKGVGVHSGVYTDENRKMTCIPATDIEGNVWTIQYIAEDGTKRFAKDSRKEGCFHVVGELESLAKAPVIIIAEGYATAATIKEATGIPVVAAFDAGNLKPVATTLREKYPSPVILIAADNDRHLEATQGINPGKEKARDAAKAVNGFVVIPIFFGDKGKEVKKQKSTDFNDLAHYFGSNEVKRQINAKMERVQTRLNSLKQTASRKVVQLSSQRASA